MPTQTRSYASWLVSTFTLVAVFVPLTWLALMMRAAARSTLAEAPDRFDLNPIAYWAVLTTSTLASCTLIGSLLFFSISTLLNRAPNDRRLFLALNAIWIYLGIMSLLGKVPGLTFLFRSTFTVSSFGWFIVIATGLPFWGPLILWFFGTANPRSQFPTRTDG